METNFAKNYEGKAVMENYNNKPDENWFSDIVK